MLTSPSRMPQKNFVEMTYSCRGQPSSAMAAPMIRSDSPPAYTSALSKKLTPASRAAVKQSRARLVSSWFPNVTHDPKESALTRRPERPRRRYSIVVVVPSAIAVISWVRREFSGGKGTHAPTVDNVRPVISRAEVEW